MRVAKFSLVTILLLYLGMLYFGRDAGLPDERIGRETSLWASLFGGEGTGTPLVVAEESADPAPPVEPAAPLVARPEPPFTPTRETVAEGTVPEVAPEPVQAAEAEPEPEPEPDVAPQDDSVVASDLAPARSSRPLPRPLVEELVEPADALVFVEVEQDPAADAVETVLADVALPEVAVEEVAEDLPVIGPVIEPVIGPEIEAVIEPVTGPVTEPAIEPEIEPEIEPVLEDLAEPDPDLVVASLLAPEITPRPARKPALPEPVVEIVEPAPELEPTPEPPVLTIEEPLAPAIAEDSPLPLPEEEAPLAPIADVPEPAPEPEVAPVAEVAVEPEIEPEPDIAEAPLPDPEPVATPDLAVIDAAIDALAATEPDATEGTDTAGADFATSPRPMPRPIQDLQPVSTADLAGGVPEEASEPVVDVASEAEAVTEAETPPTDPEEAETAAATIAPGPLPESGPEPIVPTLPDEPQGVLYVTGTNVTVRAGPSAGDREIDAMPRGAAVVDLGGDGDGWRMILLPNGAAGYIPDVELALSPGG